MRESNFLVLLSLGWVFFLTACENLHPPDSRTLLSTTSLPDGAIEYRLQPILMSSGATKDFRRWPLSRGRNLIYVAVDNIVQKQFEKKAEIYFKSSPPPRIEDVSWWRYAPLLRPLYDKVRLIPYDRFYTKTLMDAISAMESRGQPYDIFLLTHAISNYLVPSKHFPPVSYKDLDMLQGQLRNLNLVYMAGCFSSSLAPNWMAAGARHVIAYKDENENFFYPEFFIRHYAINPQDARAAYLSTNSGIQRDLKWSPDYRTLLSLMELDRNQYIDQLVEPDFF